MECAGRHHNRVTVSDEVFLPAIEDEFGSSFFNAEELIDVRVYLSPISSFGCKHITTSWLYLPVNNTWRKKLLFNVAFSIDPT